MELRGFRYAEINQSHRQHNLTPTGMYTYIAGLTYQFSMNTSSDNNHYYWRQFEYQT